MLQSTTLTSCRPFSEAPNLLFAFTIFGRVLTYKVYLLWLESQPLSKSSQNPAGNGAASVLNSTILQLCTSSLLQKSNPRMIKMGFWAKWVAWCRHGIAPFMPCQVARSSFGLCFCHLTHSHTWCFNKVRYVSVIWFLFLIGPLQLIWLVCGLLRIKEQTS